MSGHDEESLMSGVRRQIDLASARHKKQLSDMEEDKTRLETECARLKREYTLTLQQNEAAKSENARIVSETSRLKANLDDMHLEYAAALDDNAHLQAGEAMACAELQEIGKLRRRLYFEGEKVANLEEQLRRAEDAHNAGVEMEQVVAAGLRDRIGRLERRLRDKEGEERARSASLEAEHELAVLREKVEKMGRESADARHALAQEVRKAGKEKARAEALAEELREAKETARYFKEAAEERDALRAQLAELQHDCDRTPLQPVSPNAIATPKRSSAPITPKKASNSSNTSTSRPPQTPRTLRELVQLKKELAHAKAQHTSLKSAHDELNDKYTKLAAKRDKERQHFKEFHAVYMARKDAKRKRREMKITSSTVSGLGTPLGPASSTPGRSNPAVGEPQTEAEEKADAGDKVAAGGKDTPKLQPKRKPSQPVDADDGTPAPKAKRPRTSDADTDGDISPLDAMRPPRATDTKTPEPTTKRRRSSDRGIRQLPTTVPAPAPYAAPTSERQVSAPVAPAVSSPAVPVRPLSTSTPGLHTPTTAAIASRGLSTPALTPGTRSTPGLGRHTSQASRVTPWLGGNRRTSSSTKPSKLSRRDSFESDDGDDASPAPKRTQLVRDRTGTLTGLAAATPSLAPSALGGAGPSTSKDAGAELRRQTLRRSMGGLDFEGLSNEERAAERKKLSKLSTAERRKFYAPYKGNGRYVAPEEVKKTVMDEYEIDPSRNNGVAHQYDAVVRNRDERRRMHGGDCECCRDYYAAVGDIPRFNAPPAWRDDSASPNKEEERDAIEDHQNRVSRHREVWRRAPTPPDYWKIDFPSTQDVESVNRRADEMTAKREAEVRREAAHKDSKWRKKA